MNTHRPLLVIDRCYPRIFVSFCFRCLVVPVIIPFDYPEIVNVGDALGLVCQIGKGDEPVVIKWSFRGFDDAHGIQINTKHVSSKMSILSITNISASHSGTYTCTAANRAGSVSYSTNVTVNGTYLRAARIQLESNVEMPSRTPLTMTNRERSYLVV